MIAELYANMCGTEIWNRSRLSAYMANGMGPKGITLRCEPCEGLEALIPCLDDAPPDHALPLADGYQLPDLDDAPWYDPMAPESANFAGLLVLETKLSPAIDRRMVQNVGHGGSLTRPRFQARTLYVRGMLIGRTCCSVEYGLRWLTNALLGNFCGSCDGCSLTFSTCVPSALTNQECLMVMEADGVRRPYFRESEDDELSRGTDFVRQMFGTGLIEGPEVLGYTGEGGCGCGYTAMTEVDFTIGISNPWMHRVEDLVAADVVIGGCESEDCVITFSDADNCESCPPPVPCADDPNCVPVPPPVGRAPLQQCGCIPLASERTCFAVPGDREWFEQTLIIEINAGSEPLHNVAIRAWDNQAGVDCCAPENAGAFQDCDACATLLVAYVPAGGILRFDSSARTVTVTCNNLTSRADRSVGTIEGQPFQWIELGCSPACVGIDIDCFETADDATATIWRVGREL